MAEKPEPLGAKPPRAITWRSIALGLAGVIFINVLTPFNNHVLANTDLVSSYLPTGLLLFFCLFIILINAPINRFLPRLALNTSELGIAISMVLVGCALPYTGLMRYLPGPGMGTLRVPGQSGSVKQRQPQVGTRATVRAVTVVGIVNELRQATVWSG